MHNEGVVSVSVRFVCKITEWILVKFDVGGRVPTQNCEVNVIPYFTWLELEFVFSKTTR
jgi:hypothetical protein